MSHKTRVLAVLRALHRVKREVFEGDSHALEVTRQKIREEFRKNVSETDSAKIEEALVVGSDVVKLMRTSVVQLRQKKEDTFELILRESTVLPKSTPYDPTKEIPLKLRGKKCSENSDSPGQS
uniref:Complex III assembly factor LYRM7 n=1 Tax=Arion vulgaris TaxID=1028688 RepID=A0A0B6ZF94_9EUPU